MPDADVRRPLSLYSIPTPAALAAFIGFALVSFVNETAAIAGCIAVLAATAIGGSRLAWLFAVACGERGCDTPPRADAAGDDNGHRRVYVARAGTRPDA